jgi:hypothetical protein
MHEHEGEISMRRNGSISLGDAKIWRGMLERCAWMTNADIAKAADISERTAQDFTKRYAALGVLESTAACPAYFRISERAPPQELRRFTEALHVYGLNPQRNILI